MAKRVGICAAAQTTYERDKWYARFQGMALEVLESLLEQTGLDFTEDTGINHIISVSDDVFDARTISDNGMTDVPGRPFPVRGKGGPGRFAGGVLRSGHDPLGLYGSGPDYRSLQGIPGPEPQHGHPHGFRSFLHPAGGPGLLRGRRSAGPGLRAGGRSDRGATGPGWWSAAARKPPGTLTPRRCPAVSLEEVMASPLLADPIRELHAYPVSDGAVGLILASEERAREITDSPVWITGVGNCIDHFFLGDRDLASNFAPEKSGGEGLPKGRDNRPGNSFRCDRNIRSIRVPAAHVDGRSGFVPQKPGGRVDRFRPVRTK